jgi:transposase
MAEQLAPMISRDFHIVYLDETMVTKSTMPTKEWTGLKH